MFKVSTRIILIGLIVIAAIGLLISDFYLFDNKSSSEIAFNKLDSTQELLANIVYWNDDSVEVIVNNKVNNTIFPKGSKLTVMFNDETRFIDVDGTIINYDSKRSIFKPQIENILKWSEGAVIQIEFDYYEDYIETANSENHIIGKVIEYADVLAYSPTVEGIENYDKYYFIKIYRGDLDSNLSIFPDNKKMLNSSIFKSYLQEDLFNISGYILLDAYYSAEEYSKEVKRLKDISITIHESCRNDSKEYVNIIKYDDSSYDYPSYITIDGFAGKYEYALLDEKENKITYLYLAYPDINNNSYSKYLKKEKNNYTQNDSLKSFSIYNHSFDNGKSFNEVDDCE